MAHHSFAHIPRNARSNKFRLAARRAGLPRQLLKLAALVGDKPEAITGIIEGDRDVDTFIARTPGH